MGLDIQMALISIIVPVYNAEATLVRCVDTILHQTYSNIEIILVDDGASDSSGEICDELAEKDSRIRVIHQSNGGVSKARNIGVAASTGEFVCFVDADDEVESDYVEKMWEQIQHADLVVCDFVSHSARGTHTRGIRDRIFDFGESSYTDCRKLVDNSYMWGPWNKMYKRNKLVDNKIYFNHRIAYAEDAIFVYQYLLYCDTVAFVSKPLYHYNIINSTACRKYHPNMYYFLQQRFESQKALIDQKFGIDEIYQRQLLVHLAMYHLRESMRHYLRKADKSEAVSAFNQVYVYFWGHINPFMDQKDVFTHDEWKWLQTYGKFLKTGNMKRLYRHWRWSLRKDDIKKILRR